MIPIPAVNLIAVIVGMAVAIMSATVTFSISIATPMSTIIIVAAIIPVVTVAVPLSHGDGR
jgi:hypothetical protein